MLTLIERSLFKTGTCSFRRFSIALESTLAPHHHEHNVNHQDDIIEKDKDYAGIRSDDTKSLRIAIIGLPNVGKSTLINGLIKRPICAAAARIHLTRAKSAAVYCEDNTQLVFIDTPGIVNAHEFKKFKLEPSFKEDAANAMASADIVGVVQDVSNKYTRGTIHHQLLELLKMCRVGVPSLLIMNKIDQMKRKRDLLSLVRSLTSEAGWPNFSDVFMVSALNSDGVNDLRNYFLDSAKARDWDFPANVVTDQPTERLIERSIRSKLMDSLPNEIPYKLQVQIELLNVLEDGSLNCVAMVSTPSNRIAKLVLGPGGDRIKSVAREAEQELCSAFRRTVRLKVAVHFDEEPVKKLYGRFNKKVGVT